MKSKLIPLRGNPSLRKGESIVSSSITVHRFSTKWEQFNLDVLFPSLAIGSFPIGGLFGLRWKLFAADKQKTFWPFVRRRPHDLD